MVTEQGRPFLQCNVAEPKHNLSLKSFHYFVHCAAQCLISLLIYYFTKRFSVDIGLLDLSRTVLAECVGNSIRQPGSYVAAEDRSRIISANYIISKCCRITDT